MSEAVTSFRELRATDHSLHFLGSVSLADKTFEFRDEQPMDYAQERYVFANGFTGTKESMALPRCVAAKAGYDARALGSNHNHFAHTIDRYAQEIIAVASAEVEENTSENEGVHLVGISMGGAAVLRAAAHCPNLLSVTAEVPACISDSNRFYDFIQGAPERAREVKRLIKEQPGFAFKIAMSSLMGTIRRPIGTLGEVFDLATESVAEDIEIIQKLSSSPKLTIIVGERDGLVPKKGVIRAANRLDVDIQVSNTGHIHGVLTDPNYTKAVIAMNMAA